jgi:hypothetical protein
VSRRRSFSTTHKKCAASGTFKGPGIQNWVVGTNGPIWTTNLALVYAWTGERDRALEQLEKVATIPGNPEVPTYGDLLLNPCWDDLRGDPRFDKQPKLSADSLPRRSLAKAG